MRIVSVSDRDVLLYDASDKFKFVVLMGCILGGRTLHIVDKWKVSSLISSGKIGTVIFGKDYEKITKELWAQVDIIITSYFEAYEDEDTIFFMDAIIMSLHREKTYRSILETPTDTEKIAKTSFEILLNQNFLRREEKLQLSLVNRIGNCSYTNKNILHMLEVVDSIFSEEKEDVCVGTENISFEESFIYNLYFFLKGIVVNTSDFTGLSVYSKRRNIIFYDNKSFNELYHKIYKYVIFSKFSKFIERWWIFRWILRFIYGKVIQSEFFFGSRENEFVYINLDPSIVKSRFLNKSNTKTSFIFGTQEDGYTLSINRYNDKKISIEKGEYRIMDKDNSIKLHTDPIDRLYVGGKRIYTHMKDIYAIESESKLDKYFLSDVYARLNGEVLRILAHSQDLYFSEEKNVINVYDVGTYKKALESTPYVKQSEVLKIEDVFTLVVSIDIDSIPIFFEDPKFLRALTNLEGILNQINEDLDNEIEIEKIIIANKFFDEYNKVKNLIRKRDFVEYLSQQPLNRFYS